MAVRPRKSSTSRRRRTGKPGWPKGKRRGPQSAKHRKAIGAAVKRARASGRRKSVHRRVDNIMKGIRANRTKHKKYLVRRKAATGGKPGRPRKSAVARSRRRR